MMDGGGMALSGIQFFLSSCPYCGRYTSCTMRHREAEVRFFAACLAVDRFGRWTLVSLYYTT